MAKLEFKEWQEIWDIQGCQLVALFQKCLMAKYTSMLGNDKASTTFQGYVESFFEQKEEAQIFELVNMANVLINGNPDGLSDKNLICSLAFDSESKVALKSSNIKPEEFMQVIKHLCQKMIELNRLRNFMLP